MHDSLPVRQSLMRKTHLAAAVENERCWNGRDAVFASQFTAEFAEEIQPDNFCASLEVFLNPIHDGFCHEASRSSVRKEVNDDGLPAVDQRVELMPGLELCRFRPQKEEPDPDQQQEYD
jgi:hypothetical protein